MKNLDSTIERRREIFSREREGRSGTELEHLERVVRWLDDLIRIPILNIRIGLDPIIGAIPWVGDTATALFSLYLIGNAMYYRVPKIVILRMAFNVGVDYLLGIVPFIGDATDFFVKSNRWNLNLLRRYARERRRPGLSDYLFVGAVICGLVLLFASVVYLVYYSLKSAGNKLW